MGDFFLICTEIGVLLCPTSSAFILELIFFVGKEMSLRMYLMILLGIMDDWID
jgi:hypothetical protein